MFNLVKAVPVHFPTASSIARLRILITAAARVLTEFVKAGAPEEIMYVAKPHIGTFRLVTMVENMRAQIQALGRRNSIRQQGRTHCG